VISKKLIEANMTRVQKGVIIYNLNFDFDVLTNPKLAQNLPYAYFVKRTEKVI